MGPGDPSSPLGMKKEGKLPKARVQAEIQQYFPQTRAAANRIRVTELHEEVTCGDLDSRAEGDRVAEVQGMSSPGVDEEREGGVRGETWPAEREQRLPSTEPREGGQESELGALRTLLLTLPT